MIPQRRQLSGPLARAARPGKPVRHAAASVGMALVAMLAVASLAAPLAQAENDASPPLGQPGKPGARASLADIEDEVMCPICGTALNLSQSPQAERERAFIRRLINRGRSKEEIKDALVGEFGPEVLATPGSEGFDLVAWVVPGAGIVLAAIALGFGVRGWRRRSRGGGAEQPEPALDPAEQERLSSDLARYDL